MFTMVVVSSADSATRLALVLADRVDDLLRA